MRSVESSENRMIAKHMILLRDNDPGGYVGGNFKHNTRIERFWCECNANIMQHFRNEFEELEELNLLDTSNNADL